MRRLIACAALLALTACGEKAPPPDAAEKDARLVTALKVSRGGTTLQARYSGEVRARYESVLGFRVAGKMIERSVDAGARVKPGQVLARIDAADLSLAASQAEANAALAAADLKRSEELRAKNFVSQAALDARISAAKAAASQAQITRNQVGYTALTADAAGIVAVVLAEPGQVVGAGQGIVRVARDGEREVAISLPETAMRRVKVGSAATVELWADGKTYAGKVREIAPAADAATRTFAARVSLVGADAALPLGMSASVTFPAAADEEIVVPLAAVFQQNERPAVWVIGKDDIVQLRPIDVARYGDSGVVVSAGLDTGELIVAAGAFMLSPGEKVRVAPR